MSTEPQEVVVVNQSPWFINFAIAMVVFYFVIHGVVNMIDEQKRTNDLLQEIHKTLQEKPK